MKPDQEEIRKALKAVDWPALRQQLEVMDLIDRHLQIVLIAILRSDTMVRRRPGDDGTARDHLLTNLGSYLRARGLGEAADTVRELHQIFRSIDKGYVAILAEESKLKFVTLAPVTRVSSILSFLTRLGKQLHADQERAITEAGVISPNQTIKDVGGTPYNPNAAYHGLTLAATDALQLEAYRNAYFNAAGELVLPVPGPASDEDEAAAELKLINASLWRRWKTVDERRRLLQASLNELTAPNLPEWLSRFADKEKIVNAFEFRPVQELGRMDVISSERFEARMVQTYHEMLVNTNVAKIVASGSAPAVALPPQGTVSVDEAHAGTMLGQFLGLRLDQTKAGKLFLSERLRGYAVLKNLVQSSVEADGAYFPVFTRAELDAELIRCGLTAASADAFIKGATFSRSSRDMYDQPVIRLSNGSYLLFGFSLFASNLVKVMISGLENAKFSFPKRGPAFEKHIIKLLRRQGFDAKTLKVKRGSPKEEYDYDVTFVWGEYVFFIECKNRGIPFGSPVALANFSDEMGEHADQVKRLRQALVDYPDIITNDHPKAAGKMPVFCVVFSLPFSLGYQDGVYYIDESLLGRFFKPGGSLGLEYGTLTPGEPRYRVEVGRLWAGDKPTPGEFIRYMNNPPQLQIAAAKYELRADLFRLSEDMALWYADWHRKGLSDAEEAAIIAAATGGERGAA